ncbi:hypothetical protein BC833DRAFT_196810 [Globomyces pollinis-pini]|nr:hypothetical protein BC833DRAFT_196810 [Globomyces pollinis-pini]
MFAMYPRHVAIIGAAGGLGKGILQTCIEQNIQFTAIVRSRPERITNVPHGSKVVTVASLSDKIALTDAFKGTDAIVTATGATSSSSDETSLLSKNFKTLEESMVDAGVNRIVIVNSIAIASPGEEQSLFGKFMSYIPGVMGIGATELMDVSRALGNGALSSVDWTLVRAAVHQTGVDEEPAAALDWSDKKNSYSAVSYKSMGKWMLQEAFTREFVKKAPLVSRGNKK